MALIICPNCETRYEIAAVIPPEGRKVRCSKCGHIWQAMAAAPQPPVSPARPVPGQRQAPFSPAPGGPPSWIQPPRNEPAPPPGSYTRPSPPPFGGPPQRQPDGYTSPGGYRAQTSGDASFEGGDDLQPDANGGYAQGAGRYGTQSASAQDWSQDYSSSQADAEFDGEPDRRQSIIAFANRLAKVPPPVAIGWGGLALFLVLLFAFVALAPRIVVSMLPGAAGFYEALGAPVRDLDIQDVRYSWDMSGGGPVLNIEGQIVNSSDEKIDVPIIIIALVGNDGKQISAFTTEVSPIKGDASAPFTVSIPAPPQPIANLEVRFDKAS
jgi:predicted Zn finger-like uncharacterized protein